MNEEQVRAEIAADPVLADTQPNSEQSSSLPEASHDDTQNQGQSATQPVQSLPDSEPSVEVLKKEYGKLQQVQKELTQLKTEKEQIAARNQQYARWIMEDEARAKVALQGIEGMSADQAEQAIGELKKQNPDLWKQVQAAEAAATVDPYKAADEVYQINQLRARFFQTLPQLDPSNIPDASKRLETQKLATEVNDLAAAYAKADPTITPEKAWMDAYKYKTKQTDAEIEEARRQGRMEGMQIANGDKASTLNASAGSKQSNTKPVELTDLEREIARQAKMTDEEYAQFKRQ